MSLRRWLRRRRHGGSGSGGGTTPPPSDTVPNPFSFTPVIDQTTSTLIESNAVTISGIDAASTVTVSNGEWRKYTNGAWGAYTSSAGTVINGDQVQVRHTTSGSASTAVVTTLTIGGITGQFGSITAAAVDSTPDAFSFTDRTGVTPSLYYNSNVITLAGINVSVTVSCSGAGYYIQNGTEVFSGTTMAVAGDTFQLTTQASGSASTAVNTTLTIGTVADTWSVTTAGASDTTPDQFTFNPQSMVTLGATVTSNAVTIAGINATVSVSVSAGSYDINGSGTFVTTVNPIVSGNTIRARHTAGTTYGETKRTEVTINGVTDYFTSTTYTLAEITPNPFTFLDQTNVARSGTMTSLPITVSGLGSTAAAPITVTGGTYDINASGSFTSSAGTVVNGDTVRARHTSSASYSSPTNTVVTIGPVSDTFSSTTLAAPPDIVPDQFTFGDQTGVAVNTTAVAATVTVEGIDTTTSVSVIGGQWRKNNGAWFTTDGWVVNKDKVQVQHVSGSAPLVTTNTTLGIGGVSDTFSSTTASAGGQSFYVNPSTGNDGNDGLSSGTAKKTIQGGLNLCLSGRGDVVYLASGTYSNALDALTNIPANARGTASAWTRIVAVSDGGPKITQPLGLTQNVDWYVTFEGLDFTQADNGKDIQGGYVKCLRCGFKGGDRDTGDGSTVLTLGTNNFQPGSHHILLEDCFIYGLGGRYRLLCYNSRYNVIRRIVTRLDGGLTVSKTNPSGDISMYDCQDCEVQNPLNLDDAAGSPDFSGAFYMPNANSSNPPTYASARVVWRGGISIAPGNSGEYLFHIEGFTNNALITGIVAEDMAGYQLAYGAVLNRGTGVIARRFGVVNSTFGFATFGGSGHTASDSVLVNVTTAGNQITPTNTSSIANQATANTQGYKYLPRIEAGSTLESLGRGPAIVKKIGVSGTLYGETGWNTVTADDLWPWPGQARIKAAFQEDGITRGLAGSALTLTEYVWQKLGNTGAP